MGLCGESIQMHRLQFLEGWPCREAQESLFSLNSSSHEAHFLDLRGAFVIAAMSQVKPMQNSVCLSSFSSATKPSEPFHVFWDLKASNTFSLLSLFTEKLYSSLYLLHIRQQFVLRITSQVQISISRGKACLRPKLALTKVSCHGIGFPYEPSHSPQATTKPSIKILDHFVYVCIILQGMQQAESQKSFRFLTSLVSFLRQIIIL